MGRKNRTRESGQHVTRGPIPPAGELRKGTVTQQLPGGPSKRPTVAQGPELDCAPPPFCAFVWPGESERGTGMPDGSKRHKLQHNPPKGESEYEVLETEHSLFVIYGT